CGRRRVPLPASGMITFMTWTSWRWCHGAASWCVGAAPTVSFLEPHDIVELGRARLEDIAVRHGLHVMHCPRRYAEGLSALEPHAAHLAIHFHPVQERAGKEMNRLVLRVVVLHG